MVKCDLVKPINNKVGKTINFDSFVLTSLEKRCKQEGTTVSNLVNSLVKQVILSDSTYYRELSRYYYLKFQEMQYLKAQCDAKAP